MSASAPQSRTPREIGTVFVTGGASGLGAAVVEAVQEAGGTPAVLDRAAPQADAAHVRVDLADSAAALEAVEELAGRVGPPSAVVTAAGTDAVGELLSVEHEAWERVVRVNLFGTVAVVRACLPHLEKVNGSVVTVASTLALKGADAATAYAASKFGIRGFTQSLAVEYAGRVGVTCLLPGGMDTAFFDDREERFKPAPDQELNDPANTAATVLTALRQPVGCEIREMLVMASGEPSWP
ncbi:SDR family oxidoreductase [Georgenia deserti]|uniref:SDR family oxidoreductase n=1 Tax=Georgenia deserti TaxID=2093781 RepID=A0ABW4LA71_9MICO